MKRSALLFSLAVVLASTSFSAEPSAPGTRGAVATAAPEATEAALKVLQEGGNSVDAAVAAMLVLGVVNGSDSGIGGGCFMLVRTADGSSQAIDGRETAPHLAGRYMYLRQGQAETKLSQVGALAVATPGALAAYDYALSHYGKFPLERPLRQAADLAEKGVTVSKQLSAKLAHAQGALVESEAARAVFFKDRTPLAEGDLLQQADLAKTYRLIAGEGIGWFYHGPFAEMTGAWMAQHEGVLDREDFAKYEVEVRSPIRSTYRGYEVITFPPPSSGGVHLIQILNTAEGFDLPSFGPGSVRSIHVLAEAMKLAFADRAFWMGDPRFTDIPPELISKRYARARAEHITLDHTSPVAGPGSPEELLRPMPAQHTTHVCVADANGNWVSCTATINTYFGAKVMIPGTGVLLNNEMDDFSIQPGVPNAYGLVGGEANAIAPGKRPLSSMTPAFLLKDGSPVLAVGAAGGPTIISQVSLAIINFADFKMSVQEAIAYPRFHHQWKPDRLTIESTYPAATLVELGRLGHNVSAVGRFGAAQAVSFDKERGLYFGAADPRNGGAAAGLNSAK